LKRERLLALMMALAALALFYALLFPKPQSRAAGAPPLSTERGPDGLAAAAQWLRAAAVPVVSLRDRYGALAALPSPARGNLLIVSLPQRLPMQSAEQAKLIDWVQQGNTLLLLAAIDDMPQWVSAGDSGIGKAVDLTQINFSAVAGGNGARQGAAPALGALLGPADSWLEPRGHPALMRGVGLVKDSSALIAVRYRGTPLTDIGAVAIAERVAEEPAQRDAVLWVEPCGRGQIILSAFASTFSNGQIDAADNARLFANIVAWSRGEERGRVIFDDAHQGLVDFYDAQAFFADPRLHHTLEWILIVWLIWVLGAQTLRSGQPLWQPIAATSLMEASARFFQARVPERSAARRLLGNFYDEIHRWRHEPEDGAAPWEWLRAQPGVTPEQLAALRELHERVHADHDVSLSRLQNLLSQLRGSVE
jgi:hypothetical protein